MANVKEMALEKITETLHISPETLKNGVEKLEKFKDEAINLKDEAVNILKDEAVSIMDEREKKRVWSGADSIVCKHTDDTLLPGCLVLEGGSFRGCYTSGILDVFMENGINLQTTIGTSAGALNGYNYVAGEIGRAAKINLTYRHDSRFFGPSTTAKNRGVVGFKFILNEIEEELSFDHEKFDDPARRFLVTATNCETGEVLYCEKGVVGDIKKAVQASASMPFVSDMVDVDGIPCLDGGCAVKIPYQWAIDNDYEKIIVIRTRPWGYRRPEESTRLNELSERIYKNYPNLVTDLKTQSEEYNKACDELEHLHQDGRLFMICPSGSISVSTLEGDMERLGALYLLGRLDAQIMLPQVKKYLGIE